METSLCVGADLFFDHAHPRFATGKPTRAWRRSDMFSGGCFAAAHGTRKNLQMRHTEEASPVLNQE